MREVKRKVKVCSDKEEEEEKEEEEDKEIRRKGNKKTNYNSLSANV